MRMIHQPLISVCVPVYNGEKYIVETIESVLKQSYSNLEIIVQDNASMDKTWSLLQSLAQQDSRLRIERNSCNCGMAANWNMAINRAQGDYIMLLSADDLLEEGFLDKCVSAFQEHNLDVVSTNHFYLDGDQKVKRKMRVTSGVYQNCCGLILLFNPFSINFTLFKKQLVNRLRVGDNFFATSSYTCDYDLWLRLAMSGATIRYIDEPMGVYRLHAANLSHKRRKMRRQTSLVIFRHSDMFRKKAWFVYKLTLARFLTRVIYDMMQGDGFDHRHFNVLLKRLIWK